MILGFLLEASSLFVAPCYGVLCLFRGCIRFMRCESCFASFAMGCYGFVNRIFQVLCGLIREFPKIRGTVFGGPYNIIRILLYEGPLFSETPISI